MVEIVEAYVEGRPIPRSSRAFTRLASVNRGGGLVSWPATSRSRTSSRSPTVIAGSRRSASRSASEDTRSSSRPSSYAARNPRNVMTVPLAENSATRASDAVAASRTDAVEPRASAIWLATVRFQISS